jgi:hypothetical protein
MFLQIIIIFCLNYLMSLSLKTNLKIETIGVKFTYVEGSSVHVAIYNSDA